MNLPFFIVDAFTNVPFGGNPAAVCIVEQDVDAAWMQNVAAETRLSETAFIQSGSGSRFNLRWFTPTVEVNLCGHATLASALVLWTEDRVPSSQNIEFETKSGLLTATRVAEGTAVDFPSISSHSIEVPPDLEDVLGIDFVWVGTAGEDLLIEVDDPVLVKNFQPNFSKLSTVETRRGIIITAKGDTDGSADFVSRFFAPRFGIDEDPVTGSAHCALGPYWGAKLGKQELNGHQVSARGGKIAIILAEDRISLIGNGVTVMKGELQ